jgi:predicted O-methyltransferase YrrM
VNLRQYLAYPDKTLAAEAAAGAVLSKAGRRFLRKRLPPSLAELAALDSGLTGDVAELLTSAGWAASTFPQQLLHALAREHAQLSAELSERHDRHRLAFPLRWAVEERTSLLLYSLVRGLRPSSVIEMGVGNGQSSFYIIRALAANGAGQLYSFDIEPDAGGLLSEAERDLWSFRLVARENTVASLERHLSELPCADICFHDADHGYLAQYYEFVRLFAQLTDAGVLVSDDVDASYAFIDFCHRYANTAHVLLDRRKAVGLVAKSAAHSAIS